MSKIYVDANSLLLDSFKLAKNIHNSGYIPDKIIGVWRGGSLITFAIDEYFRFQGIKIRAYPLKVEAYSGNNLNKKIYVYGFKDLSKQIKKNSNVLIIDDVFDTGSSLKRVVKDISMITKNIKIATVYYKPKKNKTKLKPDFYLHETNSWIVFPHELENLSLKETKSKNSKLSLLLTTKKLRK